MTALVVADSALADVDGLVAAAAAYLARRLGGTPPLDVATLPLDDAPTYAMLRKGDATGVFQFESTGMRDALRQVKPTQFEDLVALVALYRPGPMQNIPTYARRGIAFN